ncbi:PREDICTED: protein bicaudal C homolog 1-B-like [Priapulus caudatus]|uniref:Protein bicaudal C homolog 1-B-like n=1 Tax=Priapulus caudatus TaxID=37621 RepID=A0ABM1EAS0_PRICU|nr:PREDICTED: protein bicaudal C homolog 1-B-like [Priapulus caudatus]
MFLFVTDPHIKVGGRTSVAVQKAKDKIMAILDTKSNRVTLKIDVSHTEHSHVIGKGGNNIKRVMHDTGCHIHFPDSNRGSSCTEKSNQVSIAGQAEGVESARAQIRQLLPLVFIFELPVTGVLQPALDPSSPTVRHIQQTYDIQVSFKPRVGVYTTLVMVRGSVNNSQNVKDGTAALLEHLTGRNGPTVPVNVQLEISPQHHLFVIGRGGINIKQIMQQTGASIHFPDPSNMTQQRKSTVFITGNIESVCVAREMIIRYLPLVLMLDMKHERDIDPTWLARLMEKLDVFISVKPKPKTSSKSVIIKGAEKNSAHVYEARCQLIAEAECDIPQSSSPPIPVSLHTNRQQLLVSQRTTTHCLIDQNLLNFSPPYPRSHSPLSPLPSPNPLSWSTALTDHAYPAALMLVNPYNQLRLIDKNGSGGSGSISPCESPVDRMAKISPENSYAGNTNTNRDKSLGLVDMVLPRKLSPADPMPSSSVLNGTATSQASVLLDTAAHHARLEYALRNRSFHPHPCDTSGVANNQGEHDCTDDPSTLPFDYEHKKLMATKAMQKKPVGSESRTPTDTWSGLGFSKSMPDAVIRERLGVKARYNGPSMETTYENGTSETEKEKDPWNQETSIGSGNQQQQMGISAAPGEFPACPSRLRRRNYEFSLSSSNYIDSVTLPKAGVWSIENMNTKADLPSLLTKLGLGKYSDLFQQQEIDLTTFVTLTDQDLKELGITTFGARRKMLLAISEMSSKRKQPLSPVVGDGRPSSIVSSSASLTTPAILHTANGLRTATAHSMW